MAVTWKRLTLSVYINVYMQYRTARGLLLLLRI